LATAIVAAGAGVAVTYVLLTFIIKIPLTLSVTALLQTVLIATISITAFGLFGTARVLNAKAAPYLRAE
jgi:putative ABC transport system permease protein